MSQHDLIRLSGTAATVYPYVYSSGVGTLQPTLVSPSGRVIAGTDASGNPIPRPGYVFPKTAWNHRIAYGQSLAIGEQGQPALGTAQNYSNITFGSGIKSTDGTTVPVDNNNFSPGFTTTIALVEDNTTMLGTEYPISSLTSVSTTATCVTSTPHGLITGQYVTIQLCQTSAYNGYFKVTVVDTMTFTYTFGGGSSPAATTVSVSSLTSSGLTATATTASNHNLATSDFVLISGANQANYNGTVSVVVTGPTTFTYTLPGSATSPATGTILCATARALTSSLGETGYTAAADRIVQMAQTNLGLSPASNIQMMSTAGRGGLQISTLVPQSTGQWQLLLEEMTQAFNLATTATVTYSLRNLMWDQGEADAQPAVNTSRAVYGADFLSIVTGIDAAAANITGQLNPVFTLFVQECQRVIPTGGAIALAQTDVAAMCPLAKMIGPKWQIPHASDNLHLTNVGYIIKGQMYGRACYQLDYLGKDPDWLKPLTALYDPDTGLVSVKFQVPTPPLVLDTTTWLPTTQLGFRMYDGTGDISLSGHTISSDGTTLVMTCSRAPVFGAAGAVVVQGAVDYCSTNAPGYLGNAGSANLRDSTTDSVSIASIAPCSSLTSSGTTATFTSVYVNYFQPGDTVVIAGASPSAYNGTYTVVTSSLTGFTYTFGGGSSPATGNITATNTKTYPLWHVCPAFQLAVSPS